MAIRYCAGSPPVPLIAAVIRSIACASASATLSRAAASASACRILACLSPSAVLISDCRMPSAARMRDCRSASAVMLVARRSRGPRIAVGRRRDERSLPLRGAGTVDYGENGADPRRERLVILAEPLDDHRLRLLHHTGAQRDQDDHAERDRGDEDSARTHRSELLLNHESRAVHLNNRDRRTGHQPTLVTGATAPGL